MSPEAQRIAIAEACGGNLFVIHKPIHNPFGYYRENANGYTSSLSEAWKVPWEIAKKHITGPAYEHEPDRVVAEPAPLPDYLHDLNAMHEAESFLTVVQIPIWFEHLRKICPEGTYGPYDTAFWITHSTAAQRAEAFLKTVGKWDDLK